MSEETTVTIAEPEVKAPPPPPPSREDLKSQGWSGKELDAAEKRGMIQKTDEKKPETPKPEVKESLKEPPVKEPEKKPENFLDAMDRELTPEQEKIFLDNFPPGTKPRAFYFRAKNERSSRQAAEAERDKAVARANDLEERLKTTLKPEVDENGNVIDPDDKPLTMKQLKEIRQKEFEADQAARQDFNARAARVTEAQKTQEEYAKSVYSDFDQTTKLAADLIQNLDALVPEKWKQDKALRLIRDLQISAANADKVDVDQYNAAMIAYEIGQLHPRYGKPADAPKDGKLDRPDEKANGGLTPEQMKRMEDNTQRRGSSAALPASGGKRTISVDDVGIAELNKMDSSERRAFKEKHPERYAKLLRG